VVIVPNKGFVCLEVKSAKKYQLTGNGKWQRYDELSNGWVNYSRSPWVQVTTNKHALVNILQKRCGCRSLPCGYGAAVLFPRATMHGKLPAGEDNPVMVIDSRGIDQLAQTIMDILDRWWKGEGKTGEIKQHLCPRGAQFCSSLSLDIQQQNSKLIRLTDRQFRIIQGLRRNKMIQVLGGAGTGKTLIGLELAKEAIREGQRVLFLCFSRKLSSWIASNIQEKLFLATNFHGLARKYATAASIKWPGNPDDTFWKEGVSELLLEAIYSLGRKSKFDTIIVDETQDFIGEWLIPTTELWNESGKFIMFGDENQAVFGGQVFEHKQVVKFVLQDNCRNTKQVAILCNKILKSAGVDVDQESVNFLPEGNTPRLFRWESSGDRKSEAMAQIQQWKSEKLSFNQVVVLSPWQEKNCLGIGQEDKTIDGIPFTRNLDTWRKGKACLFETIKGFKGLEADAVILVDLTEINTGFTLQDAYIACSRAKHELLIIPANIEASNLFSTWLQCS
jgi:ATP:corrinoid adenosyltransferase